MRTRFGLTLLALSLVAAACGGGDSDTTTAVAADTTTTTAAATTTTAAPATTTTTVAVDECAVDQLNLVDAGVLTVATGLPAFFPYVLDDDPTSKQGFESAVAYAVANEMGFTDDQVKWVRTGFDEAIAPGPKARDFNLQQISITPEREEVVDFSTGYYEVKQALVAEADGPAAGLTSIADLKGLRLGAQIGTTSLDLIETVIDPDSEAKVFDDNTAVQAALTADQIDAFVVDLPTALFISCCVMDNGVVVGQFETPGTEPEEFGLLFADGNSLVPCVDDALNALKGDGRLAAIEDEWLVQLTDVAVFSP